MSKSFKLLTFKPTTPSKIQGAAILSFRGIYETTKQHHDHSQYLADQTGADTIVPLLYEERLESLLNKEEDKQKITDQFEWTKTVNELQHFTEFLHRSNSIGAIGYGLGGGISCALASQLALTKHPFLALVTLYGTPMGYDARQITKTTPIQGHFGGKDTLKGFSDSTAADIFEFNLKMNTTAESAIYRYSEQSHGFLNDEADSIKLRKKHGFISEEEAKTVYTTEKEIRDLVWSRIVNFLVDQLSHHQQSANL
ncbi:hypothetical protein BJ944DRAFT_236106 [Cunninghamella echinulata]|nr:hypothetical protein BJ944DRAFT_236106 [Cunninghamella echinulata]